MESAAKLLGLEKPVEVKVNGKIHHDHKHELELVEQYKDVDPNLVIEAKYAISKIEEAIGDRRADSDEDHQGAAEADDGWQ